MDSDAEQFAYYLHSIHRYLRNSAFADNQNILTRVQWMMLKQLHRKGPMTIGAMAEHLAVRPSTMSQMVDRLEKLEFVTREQDPRDARVKQIQLTERGKDIIKKTELKWMESLTEPFSHLAAEEQETLVRLMKKLSDHLPNRGDS